MQHSKIAALALGIALFMLAGCAPQGKGSPVGTMPTAQPTMLQISIFTVQSNQPTTQTVEQPASVQRLYRAIYALPLLPADRPCTLELGPRYELTFLEKGQTLVSVTAEHYGCQAVRVSQADVRAADGAFWRLLDQTLAS